MKIMQLLIICSLVLSLGACAHLKFEDQSGKEIGAKVYTSKPYVMVSRTGAKDKPIDVQIVFLPDLSNPTYVKPIAGWGAAELSVTLSNGMLVSFGQKTDPKISELLGSIGGLATSYGGLATSLATAQKTKAEALKEQALEIEDGKRMIALSQNITDYLKEPGANNFNAAQKDFLEKASAKLKQLGDAIVNPGKPPAPSDVVSGLEGIVKDWDKTIPSTSDGTREFKEYLEKINGLKGAINNLLDKAKPKQEVPPTITLYEIVIDTNTGKSVLREVLLDHQQNVIKP